MWNLGERKIKRANGFVLFLQTNSRKNNWNKRLKKTKQKIKIFFLLIIRRGKKSKWKKNFRKNKKENKKSFYYYDYCHVMKEKYFH